MPADLIDEIGPAPDNSNKPRNSANMVMDNIDDSVYANFLDQEIIADTYSSLQRGTSRVRQHLWHSRLWSFQRRDTKLEKFLAKNQLYSNEITKF